MIERGPDIRFEGVAKTYDAYAVDSVDCTIAAGSFAYSYSGRGDLTGLTNPYSEAFSWTYLDNGWMKTQSAPDRFSSRTQSVGRRNWAPP